MWPELGLVVGAYLFGSLPLVYLLGRWRGIDLRRMGSGNIGGGNLWQLAGPPWGIAGGLADVSKGALPVVAGRALGFDLAWPALAGLAGMAGQMWPPFLKFGGGRGNSAGLGLALTLGYWYAFLVGILPMLLGASKWGLPHLRNSGLPWRQRLAFRRRQSRSVGIGMLTGFAAFPLIAWIFGYDPEVVLACLGAFLLIALRRLTAGLFQDLGQGVGLGPLLVERFLYDRGLPRGASAPPPGS